MPSDRFRMDHGKGYTTVLVRQPARIGGTRMVWKPAPGEKIQMPPFDENIEQHPIDCFGLPLFGKFIDPSA